MAMTRRKQSELPPYEIDPGEFRHVVEVSIPSYIPDGAGGFRTVVPAEPSKTIYALVEELREAEVRRNGMDSQQTWYYVTCRYQAAIQSDWILHWRGMLLAVKGFCNVENRDRITKITATKLTNVR